VIAHASIERTAWLHGAPSASRAEARQRLPLGLVAWLASTVLLLGGAWWLLAPPELGGQTSIVTVDGTSMLPRFQRDDLVLLRTSGSYRVGDVVGYHSNLLGRVVMHRIVAIEDGRYTFKGDNNHFLDPERPTRSQLVGRLWLRVPAAGRVIPLLKVPWIVGALAALLVLALGLERGGAGEETSKSGPR